MKTSGDVAYDLSLKSASSRIMAKKTSYLPRELKFLRACMEVNAYPSPQEKAELGAPGAAETLRDGRSGGAAPGATETLTECRSGGSAPGATETLRECRFKGSGGQEEAERMQI